MMINYLTHDYTIRKYVYFIYKFIFRKTVICFVIIIFVVLGFYSSLYNYSKCSNDEIEKALFILCAKYQSKEALGNLCDDLCDSKNVIPSKCLPNHSGKDIVFEAKYNENPIIIKSSKLYPSDFDQIYYEDTNGNKIYPQTDMFYSMVFNTLQSNLGLPAASIGKQSLNLIQNLWTDELANFSQFPSLMKNAIINNIWFLMQQNEYLLSKYYENTNIFPKIIGSCGSFYAVEYIEPLDNFLMVIYPTWKYKFPERAKVALKVLKFLEDLKRQFPTLHICDIKIGHLGFDQKLRMKILDSDMAYFKTTLLENMIAIKNCTNDQECAFIDCKGSCLEDKQICEAKITDTNFQRICNSIFTGKLMKSYFGLLSSPPQTISKELNILLQRCSEIMNGKEVEYISNQLKTLLSSYLLSINA